MTRWLVGLCVFLLFPAVADAGHGPDTPPPRVGTLSCEILPHSGINLLIHSTREIRCSFKPEVDGDKPGAEESYRGETGIGFGFDVAIKRSSTLEYAVFTRHFEPGTHQLAGKYEGTGGGATLGFSVGESAPLQTRDGRILLQPIGGKDRGAGAAAGYTYLFLQADTH